MTRIEPGKYTHEAGGLPFNIEKLWTAGPRGGHYWSWCVTGRNEKASDFLRDRWPHQGLVVPFASLRSAIAQLDLALKA
jgi:hypothetical protein